MIKYFPYKSDKPGKKYYIITNNNKKVYFGASGYSDFTIHKDEARKQRNLNRHKIMKYGLNLVLIPPVGGVLNICGHIQQRRKHTTTLKRI